MASTASPIVLVLIESDWNLKSIFDCCIRSFCRRINRIRLEFKVMYLPYNSIRLLLVLIESDWNLKDDSLIFSDSADVVLIESDWNLKYIVNYKIESGE